MIASTGTRRPLRPSLRTVAERDVLVVANLPLVKWCVSRLPAHRIARQEDCEDLAQIGAVALIRAAELWDETRKVQFVTYATWAVRNGLLKRLASLRKRDRLHAFSFDERRVPLPLVLERDHLAESDEAAMLLLKLPGRLRLVVRRRLLEERTADEIGSEMDLGQSRVGQLVRTALGILRKRAGASD
jgi:RNA polymerase sigma factor (sigma-70 family)